MEEIAVGDAPIMRWTSGCKIPRPVSSPKSMISWLSTSTALSGSRSSGSTMRCLDCRSAVSLILPTFIPIRRRCCSAPLSAGACRVGKTQYEKYSNGGAKDRADGRKASQGGDRKSVKRRDLRLKGIRCRNPMIGNKRHALYDRDRPPYFCKGSEKISICFQAPHKSGSLGSDAVAFYL